MGVEAARLKICEMARSPGPLALQGDLRASDTATTHETRICPDAKVGEKLEIAPGSFGEAGAVAGSLKRALPQLQPGRGRSTSCCS